MSSRGANPASTTVRLTHRYVFMSVLLALSAIGIYDMRVRPSLNGIPIDFEESVALGQLHHPITGQTVKMRKHYTGLDALDQGLQFLVLAFISGPARVETRIWLQQLHFFAGFAPIIGVMAVESCRERWHLSKAVRYTSLWALLYQTIGGAVIMPLYSMAFVYACRLPEALNVPARAYFTAGQDIDQASLQALIPAVTLGYILPTAMLYLYQFSDMDTTMGLIAIWQVTPIIINMLLTLFKYLLPTQRVSGSSRKVEDRTGAIAITRPEFSRHIYSLYVVLIGFAGVAHLYTLWVIFTSPSALETFRLIFIPDFADTAVSTSAGLHNIFQWDWILIAVAQLTCGLYAVLELGAVAGEKINLVKVLTAILSGIVLLGPGAAVACIWAWREARMIQIAQGLKRA